MSGWSSDRGAIGETRPGAWVVSDEPATAAIAAAEACGFRIDRTLTMDQAVAAVAARRGVPMILVEIGAAFSEDAAAVLDLVDGQAMDNRTAAVVSCALPALDQVAASLSAPYATLLCDPSPADRVMAICAAAPAGSGVAENDRAADARHLLDLVDEAARIARVIAGLSSDGMAGGGVRDRPVGYRSAPPRNAPVPVTGGDIRAMIRWRRRRDALLSDALFADPAWDMILDLCAAQAEDVDVAVSSLCIAAAVPATTALRWIRTLTDAGVFERVADPHDRRRIHIRLRGDIATAVLRFLGEAKGAGLALI